MVRENKCPFCHCINSHSPQCNLGSSVSAQELRDIEQRTKDKKKKFENERVYKKGNIKKA